MSKNTKKKMEDKFILCSKNHANTLSQKKLRISLFSIVRKMTKNYDEKKNGSTGRITF